MQQTYNPTWDLDVIFPGGSDSEAFRTYLKDIEKDKETFSAEVEAFTPEDGNVEAEQLTGVVNELESVMKKLREASAFISCLSAQDVTDEKASLLVGKRSELRAELDAIMSKFVQKLVAIEDTTWVTLLQHDGLAELSFVLNEIGRAHV